MITPFSSGHGSQISAKALNTIAIAGLFLLYPGYFFYNYLSSVGVIPRFIGGYYSVQTLLILTISIIAIIFSAEKYRNSIISSLIISIYFYILFWVVLFGYVYPPASNAYDINIQILLMLLQWASLIILGYNLEFSKLHYVMLIVFGWSMMLLISAYIYVTTGNALSVFQDFSRAGGDVGSYQGLSRSFFISSIFLVCFFNSFFIRISISIFSILILFLLSARSEFVAFIFIVLSLEFYRSKNWYSMMIAMPVIISGILYMYIEYYDIFIRSRISGILFLDEDTSWIERNYLLSAAVNQIKDNLFLGVYGGHFDVGGQGSYAHNAISAWVSFGLIGFLLYVSLNISSFMLSWHILKSNLNDPKARFSFAISAAVLLLSLTSKSVFWAEAGLAWGLTASLLAVKRTGPARRASSQRRPT